MGFREFLFGRQLRLEDEVFGSLLYFDCKNPENNYFEGKRLFTPTGTRIEVLLTAGPSGPSTAQHAFYEQIEAQYPTLLPALAWLITTEVRNWQPDFEIQNFVEEFQPTLLELPAISKAAGPVDWELSFETIHDQNHTFVVSRQGFTPYKVQVDG
ncbi:hypothetical protein [Hymenobacter cellulosilyticus]|uniref:Uncharacterized protein n=1 Tax=Hymenobacter cellulosilyticus TaxID=2932248 RepID=A0A8T9Q203_9BACT|nr:hypothetical protein [Hymenobacter cellulosilyticus]UOQ71766.1 hypothetical protein MUN79_24705 [Hymenobacter cellulosilyticus]